MKPILKDDFYKILEDKKLDLCYNVTETSKTHISGIWKYRNGVVFGKTETTLNPYNTTYYIQNK